MKHPNMREELISYLEDLADEGERHFIYDDTPLADHPERAVGFFLKGATEVRAVKDLVGTLELLFENHGTAREDARVGSHAEWTNVKTRSRELLALLRPIPT